jgi:hypothetical protein
MRKSIPTKEDLEKYIDKLITYKEISEIYGVSLSTIKKWCLKYNLKSKNSKSQPVHTKCLNCEEDINTTKSENKKFCNNSCSASYNNKTRNIDHSLTKITKCVVCVTEFSINKWASSKDVKCEDCKNKTETHSTHKVSRYKKICSSCNINRIRKNKNHCDDCYRELITDAIEKSITMAEAAKYLGMSLTSFKKYAIKFGLYSPNQGRKGITRDEYEDDTRRIPLNDILNGYYPFYSTGKLKKRLLRLNMIENKCAVCEVNEWMGKELVCELDHIDGNNQNHKLENLRMLCPNCHSQTETFRGRNINKRQKYTKYTKEEFVDAVESSESYTDIKKKLGLTTSGPNNHIKHMMYKYDIRLPNNQKSKTQV